MINARRWISEAVARREFSIPTEDYPPPAELDGEPVDARAMMYAVIVELGNGSPFTLPDEVSATDIHRCLEVVRELL